MKPSFKLAAAAVVLAVLAACGGGDDNPTPTDQDAILTLSSATDRNIEGVYGTSNISLSEVVKTEREGTDDCSYVFSDVRRAFDPTNLTIGGRVEYQDASTVIQNFRLTIGSANYATANSDNTSVDRDNNRVRVTNKQLTEEGGTRVVTVSGIIPMRPNRPGGC